jgi:hypothetical protein
MTGFIICWFEAWFLSCCLGLNERFHNLLGWILSKYSILFACFEPMVSYFVGLIQRFLICWLGGLLVGLGVFMTLFSWM